MQVLKKMTPIHPLDSDVIEFEKLNFKKINVNKVWHIEQLIGYDAIILDASNLEFARYFINMMRSHHNSEYYLKPLFIYKPHPLLDIDLQHMYDGEYKSEKDLPEMKQVVWDIFLKTTELEDVLSLSYEAQIIKRVLNYFYTRSINEINCNKSTSSNYGYVYPILNAILKEDGESKGLDLLEWAEQEGLIAGKFHERIYLCNKCSGGFLSFREVCPSCHSSDSNTEDLVHHFPCAYIGPMSDFEDQYKNELNCPKCNKNLRHIGVDYDKPSVIHHCNQCKADFQDLLVHAKCICCSADTEVQFLIPKKLKKYEIMKKGKLAAISGILASESQKSIPNMLRFDTFKIMLQHEIDKVKYYKEPVLLLSGLSLHNLYELQQRIGRHAYDKLIQDLLTEVKNLLRSIDLVSMDNDDTIFITILDTDIHKTNSILSQIKALITSLIYDNFRQFEINIKVASIDITTDNNIEDYIALLKKQL
ncbi:MAG: hypothetical protein WCP57_12955 [Bacteroidota bacterium]